MRFKGTGKSETIVGTDSADLIDGGLGNDWVDVGVAVG